MSNVLSLTGKIKCITDREIENDIGSILWAAITKYHRLGVYKQQKCNSYSSGVWSPRLGCQHGWDLHSPLPSCRMLLGVASHGGKGVAKLFAVLFIRALILFMVAPAKRANYLSRPYFHVPPQWRLDQQLNLWGIQTFRCVAAMEWFEVVTVYSDV